MGIAEAKNFFTTPPPNKTQSSELDLSNTHSVSLNNFLLEYYSYNKYLI